MTKVYFYRGWNNGSRTQCNSKPAVEFETETKAKEFAAAYNRECLKTNSAQCYDFAKVG